MRNILASLRAGGKGSDGAEERQDVPDGTAVLDRRQLLTRAAVLGLVVAAPTPLQRFWALDQTMIRPAAFAEWAEGKASRGTDWLIWVKGPETSAMPFHEVIAAKDIPALIDGGHWRMLFDTALQAQYGPASLIRYVEQELTELSGEPARVTRVNGTRIVGEVAVFRA